MKGLDLRGNKFTAAGLRRVAPRLAGITSLWLEADPGVIEVLLEESAFSSLATLQIDGAADVADDAVECLRSMPSMRDLIIDSKQMR